MPDLSIRGFTPEQYAALKAKAGAAGARSLESWARDALLEKLSAPVIRETYKLTASSGPVYFEVRRTPESLSSVRPFLSLLNEEQRAAVEQALTFIKRNGPGDREAAIAALGRGFENVQEHWF